MNQIEEASKMFCPNHGKLSFDQIVIKNNISICKKCLAELEFGEVNW